MSEDTLIASIVENCLGEDSFLVKLHSYNEFDKEKYKLLLNDLHLYYSLIESRYEINRKIAGCLLALQQEFDNKVFLLSENQNSVGALIHIEQAHQAMSELIGTILEV